jgi:hypothetical protein
MSSPPSLKIARAMGSAALELLLRLQYFERQSRCDLQVQFMPLSDLPLIYNMEDQLTHSANGFPRGTGEQLLDLKRRF